MLHPQTELDLISDKSYMSIEICIDIFNVTNILTVWFKYAILTDSVIVFGLV